MFNNRCVSVVFLVKIQKNPQQSSSKRHSSKIKYLFFDPNSLRPSGKKIVTYISKNTRNKYSNTNHIQIESIAVIIILCTCRCINLRRQCNSKYQWIIYNIQEKEQKFKRMIIQHKLYYYFSAPFVNIITKV